MDDLGKSLPGAEGIVEAGQSRKGQHNVNCLNCGTKLTDDFCPHCSQKDLPRRQTLVELWENFISSFFSFEGKFFRTTKYLVLKPGFLAVEYTTTAFLDTLKKDSVKPEPKRKKRFNYSLSLTEYKSLSQYDSTQAALPESKRDGWFVRKMTRRSIELNEKYGENPAPFGNDFWKASLGNFSKVLFFLLPVFALLLKLFYARRDYFYSEHLVYYNFFYFAGSLVILLGLVPQLAWLSTLLMYVIYFYPLVAMKRMYGQGWGKTIAKFFVFSMAFMIWFFRDSWSMSLSRS